MKKLILVFIVLLSGLQTADAGLFAQYKKDPIILPDIMLYNYEFAKSYTTECMQNHKCVSTIGISTIREMGPGNSINHNYELFVFNDNIGYEKAGFCVKVEREFDWQKRSFCKITNDKYKSLLLNTQYNGEFITPSIIPSRNNF